jgi:hypothetical protein
MRVSGAVGKSLATVVLVMESSGFVALKFLLTPATTESDREEINTIMTDLGSQPLVKHEEVGPLPPLPAPRPRHMPRPKSAPSLPPLK